MEKTNRFAAFGLFCALAGGILAPTAPVLAQTKTHHSFLHRHRNAAAGAAGIGAYEAAKRTGNARKARGQHRNFAQRHPFLTGAAAAGITHHYAKKHK